MKSHLFKTTYKKFTTNFNPYTNNCLLMSEENSLLDMENKVYDQMVPSQHTYSVFRFIILAENHFNSISFLPTYYILHVFLKSSVHIYFLLFFYRYNTYTILVSRTILLLSLIYKSFIFFLIYFHQFDFLCVQNITTYNNYSTISTILITVQNS